MTCSECGYVPRSDSVDPKRTFKAHVRKKHPEVYFRTTAPKFVIKEDEFVLID